MVGSTPPIAIFKMKEVKKKLKQKERKIFLLNKIIDALSNGKYPAQISEEYNISKQKLNYYIRLLKKEGIIKKEGYGVWKVREVKKLLPNTLAKKEIRGHAFIWTIKLKKRYDWSKLIINLDYKLIRGKIPRLIIKNRKIWLGSKRIVIYEPYSFYATNALQSKKYAVINLIEILELLEKKLKINLKPYKFRPAREHYGLIKNDLAQQCNRKGEKLHISDDLDGEWLWIDDSLNLGELETGGKGVTKDRAVLNIGVQNWWNDHKKHDFKVTPSFIMESITGMIQVQQMHSTNIIKHQQVLDEMLITLKKIQENLEKK